MIDFEFERDAPIDARTGKLLRKPTLQEIANALRTLHEMGEQLPFGRGADMSTATWERIKLLMSNTISNERRTLVSGFGAIEVHFVEEVPLGEVRECTCGGKHDKDAGR